MSRKPTVLMILDGYGLNDRTDANAVAEAKTPVMDKLMAEYPFVKGYASGLEFGSGASEHGSRTDRLSGTDHNHERDRRRRFL